MIHLMGVSIKIKLIILPIIYIIIGIAIFKFLKNHNRMVAYLMKSGMSETHTRLQSYLAPLKLS